MPPIVLKTRTELREQLAVWRREGKSLGLVPTMGALHAGHASLVDASRRECDITLATIFVNPTQFGPNEDFSRYPRTLEADLELLVQHGADAAFSPPAEEIYRPGDSTFVEVGNVAEPWEGAFRPGHFRGVATIVLKLFNLTQPDLAFFGQKDFQQSLVVRRMVADLDLPIQIRVCPTVREPDGLAMSSRNRYLSPPERERALAISQSLRMARELVQSGTRDAQAILARMREQIEAQQMKIDYVALADPETLASVNHIDRPVVALVAARLGTTRLIDNELIET
jgi:pantoate--beta-alanine ligase